MVMNIVFLDCSSYSKSLLHQSKHFVHHIEQVSFLVRQMIYLDKDAKEF